MTQSTQGTCLVIDLVKIRHNSRMIVDQCKKQDIEVLGVTKGFTALPRIVEAMAAGGITRFADARLENINALRQYGFTQDITLLRIPMLSHVREVVSLTNCSLNSELSVIEALSDVALQMGTVHNTMLMVDVGDLREGVMPGEAHEIMNKVMQLKGVHVCGIGTNMGCYGGILPTEKNLNLLLQIAHDLESISGEPFEEISGGGTSSLILLDKGEVPRGITQLRIGEGLLLGTDTTHNASIPWLAQDAFVLKSEIVEVKDKPSIPSGEIGRNAFGSVPEFVDNGIRKRAIIALGKQDVTIEGITPLDSGISILGASSDHMILDITDAQVPLQVGDQISFKLNYQGLLYLCNSRYVKKQYLN